MIVATFLVLVGSIYNEYNNLNPYNSEIIEEVRTNYNEAELKEILWKVHWNIDDIKTWNCTTGGARLFELLKKLDKKIKLKKIRYRTVRYDYPPGGKKSIGGFNFVELYTVDEKGKPVNRILLYGGTKPDVWLWTSEEFLNEYPWYSHTYYDSNPWAGQ